MAQVEYKGTGRRKNSVARVRLVPGEGNITVNNRDVRDYLPFESLILDLNQPFDVTETKGNYDVLVNVHGGGFTGQAQAIRHGIARALLEADPEYRGSLKRAGLLTRDPRMKERKNQVLKSSSFSSILKTLILANTHQHFPLFGKCFLCYYNDDETNYKVPNLKILSNFS